MPRRCAWRGAGWSAPASSTCRTRFVTKIESKNPAWARAGVPRSKAGLQKGGHPRTPWGTVGPANNGFLVLHERSSIRPRRVCLPPLCSLSPQRATHHAPSQASAARCRAAIQPGAVSHWNAPSCAQGWFWRGFPQRRREGIHRDKNDRGEREESGRAWDYVWDYSATLARIELAQVVEEVVPRVGLEPTTN